MNIISRLFGKNKRKRAQDTDSNVSRETNNESEEAVDAYKLAYENTVLPVIEWLETPSYVGESNKKKFHGADTDYEKYLGYASNTYKDQILKQIDNIIDTYGEIEVGRRFYNAPPGKVEKAQNWLDYGYHEEEFFGALKIFMEILSERPLSKEELLVYSNMDYATGEIL